LLDLVESDHLLRIPAIQHLQQTDPLLYRLLELFSQDTLEAFHAFHKEHPEFLSSVGKVPRFVGAFLKIPFQALCMRIV